MGRLGVSRKRGQRKWGSSRRRDEREVRHRASPGRIMKLYAHLTAGQREMIEGSGFGALLRIQCPTLPSRICTWLIHRFDLDSCELVIPGRGRIPVTVDSVHRVLGIPNTGRDVVYRMDEKSIEFVFDKLGVERPPSVASLEKSIKLMKSADEHFLRTFMMLVLSTFLCPNSSLKVSPRCFPSLVDVGSIKELNWCRFVVEQLENCISSYGKKNTVGGCLFFLLILYLDSLDIQGLGIPDGTPRISAWDQKLMSKVIVMDRKTRTTFGKCFLKREPTRKINSRSESSLKNSRSASVLLGDASAIANFVSSNVVPEYSPQNKEVLCKATGNLCASITDALAKFMREVSGLEGCSREAGKSSTEVVVREDNNVENDGDQVDVDKLPDDSSELATKDMEDTSVDEYEDESSGEGEAVESSSADSEDDPDWKDFSNSITQFHSRQNRVTRNSENSKEPGDGDVSTNGSGNVTTNGSGNDSDIPEGNLGRVSQCSEEQGHVVKLTSPNVHEDVVLPSSALSQARAKSGDVPTNGSGNDFDIPEKDQDRVNRCGEEHVNVAKLIAISGHEDVVVPTSAVSQAKSTRQKKSKKRYLLEDKMAIQPARQPYDGPSTVVLYGNGNPSKEEKNIEKTPVIDFCKETPVIDLSTPTNSDDECTVKRTKPNPPSVKGPQRS
uniref:Uncharacterized protein n=1 Tax=Avena sativa TaxID=4498 RepID=A0ACD5TID5_AVESA